MKKFKKVLVALLAIVTCLSFTMAIACSNPDPQPQGSSYTVTFMVEGAQYGNTQSVRKGRFVTKPTDPTFSNADYVFTAWFTDEACTAGNEWVFDVNTVTANTTLYAGYRVVADYVSNVMKADEKVTSKLVWTQRTVSDASSYEVIITNSANVPQTLEGTVSFDAANYLVTFTPNVIPQGGRYNVSVKDTTKAQDAATAESVLFGGAGTQANPYLIGTAVDFEAVNQADVANGTYFQLANNISITTSRAAQSAYVFNGTLIGGGRTITIEDSNTAAIYKTGADAYIYNVQIAGRVSTGSNDSVGTIVDFNAGKIEKVSTTANVESTSGLTGSANLENALNTSLEDGQGNRGIAGGIVGTNLEGGIIYNCKIKTESSSTGTIKATIGGGTIVGLNFGTVEMCTSEGCFGAWNSKETGKSTSAYSYGGGIAGINAGTITKCAVKDSAKLLTQRLTTDLTAADNGTSNSAIGGVVGYNMENGNVTECYFSGIRVHGDINVGGIAGINAGTISDVYFEGVQKSTDILAYVGGRTNVGGIVGKLEAEGTVANAFVTGNVFAYGEGGIAYSVAEKANNSVYLSNNLDTASKNDGTLNAAPAALVAPQGTNNVAVAVVGGSHDGQTNDYALADTYLSTINANSKFVFETTTIKLVFEGNVLPEEQITVDIYVDGAVATSVVVKETGKAIDAPSKTGYKHIGWALTNGGEVAFEATATISLFDLIDYTIAGKSALYAVYEEKAIDNTVINISVWTGASKATPWITTAELDNIKAAFNKYLEKKGYDLSELTINFVETTTSDDKVAGLGELVNTAGNFDIVIGCGNNINTSAGVSIEEKADISLFYVANDRMAARLTDNALAVELFNMLKADTTLKVSVWTKGGSWVTADEMTAIESGFKAYLTAKGYEGVDALTISFVETITDGNKVAELGAVVNEAGDFDIVVGCGNNINSTAGVSIVEKADVQLNYIAADRMVARLTFNTLACELYTYLTTAPQA